MQEQHNDRKGNHFAIYKQKLHKSDIKINKSFTLRVTTKPVGHFGKIAEKEFNTVLCYAHCYFFNTEKKRV